MCLTQQTKALIMIKHLRYWPSTFVHLTSDKALSLLKTCLPKFQSNCVKSCSIRFKIQYYVNKIEFYCSTKDKTAVLCTSPVVYDFSCPGCSANYVGKRKRILYEKKVNHAWTDNNSAVYKVVQEWLTFFLYNILSVLPM